MRNSKIPLPKDEAERLQALKDYEILDTPAEEAFDRITRIASRVLQTPISVISLVDANRQWFKSRQGLDATETPREIAFCTHAILQEEVMVVTDATQDPRFKDNPLVTGDPKIRFYAGAPLRTRQGHGIGTLCAIDRRPREITAEQSELLQDLAQLVIDEMELRLQGQRMLGELRAKEVALAELKSAHARILEESNERRRAEEALNDREARTRVIVDTVLEGIITIDDSGVIETVNPAACRTFGYESDEVIGKNVSMLMPEPFRGAHDGYIRNYLATGKAKIIGIGREVLGQHKDGSTFPMELSVAPMTVADRKMFTGVVRDITERKRIDEMKNEFVSTVSHELRTPLTSIKGSLGLLRGGLVADLPDKAKRMIDIAYQNSDRLVRLINEILDVEKIEAGMMKYEIVPVKAGELLAVAVETNRGFGDEHGVSITLDEPLPDVTVKADRDRMMQVLANLLSNAIKYSPEGGAVSVSATLKDQVLRVSVADRGPGIPEKFHESLFAKFAQADSSDTREKGGSGLGLAISKAIVEQHGGSIGFETEIGKGTTFHFDLPVWKPMTGAESAAPASADDRSVRPRILVCEHDRDIATLIVMMIEPGGFDCDVAYSASEAKEMLAGGRYAAMTLDLGLPDQNGLALIREIRDTEPMGELPIIIVSGTPEAAAADMSPNALNGALKIADWLQKPIDQEALRLAVRRALKNDTRHRPRILHIEDDEDIISVVSVLVGGIADVTPAATKKEAIRLIHEERFELVILDLMLPDGSGEDLLCELRRSANSKMPVIVFSAREPSTHLADRIAATLVKSRASNDDLLAVVKSAL